jgi:hypothetical protein
MGEYHPQPSPVSSRVIRGAFDSSQLAVPTDGPRADGADLIGIFHAGQRRERFLINSSYSHYVVVFRSGIALLESAHWRDLVSAVLRVASVPLEVGKALAITPQIIGDLQNGDSFLAKFVGSLDETQVFDAKQLSEFRDLTPAFLDQNFKRVTGVSIEQITSAVLNRGPLATAKSVESIGRAALTAVPLGTQLLHLGPLVAELVIKFRVNGQRNDGELWLRPDRSELWLRPGRSDPLDEVAKMMREALGKDRFSEQAGIWRAVRGVFPGRGLAIER